MTANPGTASSCCPPSTSPTARPYGSCRARPAPRRRTASRWPPRSPGSRPAPSGSTWSTSTPLSAGARTASCSPRSSAGSTSPSRCRGGIRDDASLDAALSTGCARVNIGTAALEDPDWCASAIARHGERVAVGLDVRGTTLAARGWTQEGGELFDVLARLDRDGCARYVVTDVGRDGTMTGPNLDLLRIVCAATDRPVVASGGVSSPRRPPRHRGARAGRRRGSDRRQGALRRGVHAGGGAGGGVAPMTRKVSSGAPWESVVGYSRAVAAGRPRLGHRLHVDSRRRGRARGRPVRADAAGDPQRRLGAGAARRDARRRGAHPHLRHRHHPLGGVRPGARRGLRPTSCRPRPWCRWSR